CWYWARRAGPMLERNFPATGCAENRPPARQQSTEPLEIERNRLLWFEQTFVPAKNADAFPPAVRRGFCDCANHRVQAGTIPTAGEHANSLAHVVTLSSARPARRRGFRGSARGIHLSCLRNAVW